MEKFLVGMGMSGTFFLGYQLSNNRNIYLCLLPFIGKTLTKKYRHINTQKIGKGVLIGFSIVVPVKMAALIINNKIDKFINDKIYKKK